MQVLIFTLFNMYPFTAKMLILDRLYFINNPTSDSGFEYSSVVSHFIQASFVNVNFPINSGLVTM